ncbi:MAG: DUF393 domain-containing protein [Verrucomicrobia bacterium]|nr:DUF393 domain-containing protein [Verrucomicrobiota bacterium]
MLASASASTSAQNDFLGEQTVLFFDGVCGLCNRTVDFLIARDRAGRIRYAPLQGETFRAVAETRPELRAIDSVIVMRQRRNRREFLVRSRAVLFALSQLGGGWEILRWLALLVPQPISDALYREIARVRYRIWGKRDVCRLPTAAERGLFLP